MAQGDRGRGDGKGDGMTARKCGDCQLCCRLLPVRELSKLDNVRCRYQRHGKGCSVHGTGAMPRSCALWSCRWLVQPEATSGLSRPDRVGYVIDIMPEFITARDDATGEISHVQVVQVWIDPSRPHAHKDPALRAYLEQRGRENIAGLVRRSASDGFVLAPPNMTGGKGWMELNGISGPDHTPEELVNTLGSITLEFQPDELRP